MEQKKLDLDIFNRFGFDRSPVGVRYSSRPPSSINRLEEKLTLCEMLKKAQEGHAFYADVQNNSCGASTYVLGQEDIHEQFINGEFGAACRIFDSPRSAGRLYHYIPKIEKGVVKFISLAPLDKLQYDPDVLIVMSRPEQTEILLRSTSYQTGKMWSSFSSAAIGCAWLFVYPFLSGEVNYVITGLGHGMKRRKLFQEGYQLVAIPLDRLPAILDALTEMPWVLPAYKPDGLEFVGRVVSELGIE